MLAVFGTLLLARIPLNVRVYHYGFALAMPAFLTATAIAASWIPEAIRHAGIQRSSATCGALRLTTLVVLALFTFEHLKIYAERFRIKPVTIAAGTPDEFRADRCGLLDNAVIEAVGRMSTSSMAVVPQGVMMNYLLRRTNPTPFVTLLPAEVLAFGDEVIASAYRTMPPDILVVIGTDFREYGFERFEDFAPKTAEVIGQDYAPIGEATPENLPPITILKHSG